jgi:hypothetical protein
MIAVIVTQQDKTRWRAVLCQHLLLTMIRSEEFILGEYLDRL